MSKRQSIRRKKISLAATTAAAATLAAVAQLAPVAPTARAASVTWTGGGADDNWSTGANWTPSGYTNGDSITFDGTTRLTPNNNTAADNQVSGITFAASAGAFTLSGNRVTLVNAINQNATNNQTFALDLLLSGNQGINAAFSASGITINSIISDGGSFSGINKGGGGTVTLNGVNTYKGNTSVSGGTLVLNGNSASAASIDSTGQLVLGGGSNGTFSYIGNAAGSTQTFSSMTLLAGRGAVSVTSNGAAANLNLNSIGRNSGAIVNFVTPASGNITTTSTHQNGTILGGWATVNGTTWAVTGTGGGGPFNVTGLATYQTDFNTSTNDVDVPTGTTTLSAATSVNSMRFNSAGTTTTTFAGTGALTLNSGGILMTSNVTTAPTWSHTGTLTSSSGELNFINTSSQTLTVASQVAGNITLNIAAGTSTVTFTNNNNSFTGDVNIISGRFGTTNNNGLMGTTSNLVRVFGNEGGGGQYFQGNVSLPSSRNFQISGYGYAESGGGSSFGAIRMRNTIAGIVTLAGNARVGNNGNNAGTFSGKITGAYEFAIMNENGVHQNALIISGTTNDYSGGTRIERGKLAMGAVNALPQDTLLTFGTAFSNATTEAMRVRGSTPPTLDLNSRNTSISGATVQASDTGYTANGGTATIMNSSGTAATLTVGASGASSSFSGVLTANMGLTKTGGGTFTMSHTNYHTGATTVSQGTLAVTGAAVAAATGKTGTWTTNNSLTVNSSANLFVGQLISSTTAGIPANTYITNISGTTLSLSANTTAAGTAAPLTIPGGNGVGAGPILVNGSGILNTTGVSGGLTLVSGQTLTNNNTVNGSVNVPGGAAAGGTGNYNNTLTLQGTSNTSGGILSPGTSVGTTTINTLTASGGGQLNFEFDSTVGQVVDMVNVTGTATLAGAGINFSLITPPAAGTYTILTAGTLASNPVLNTPTVGRNTFSLDFGTANTIKVTVAGSPGVLTWNNAAPNTGDGVTWDTGTGAASQNWRNGANPDTFFQNDNVTFNDTNNGKYAVTIAGSVNPGSTTVNATGNYTFGGGTITGLGSLTKSSTGSLTINNTGHTYSGGTILNAGTLNIGGTTTSVVALGTGTLTLNGGTLDNLAGGAITLPNNIAQAWGGSFVFSGTNSLNMGTGAVTINAANPTVTVSNNTLTVGGAINNGSGNSFTKAGTGTLTLTGAGSFNGGMTINAGTVRLGNVAAAGSGGTVTVNSGGALVLQQVNPSNPVIVNNGAILSSGGGGDAVPTGDYTFNGNSTIYSVDVQNPGGTSRNFNLAGAVHGSGNITVINSTAVGAFNVTTDGNQGVRFVGSLSSDYSGTVTYSNNTKGELLTTGATGSPAGTGKFILTAGAALFDNSLNATTGSTAVAGYTEFNIRNSGGDTVLGNDFTIAGTGFTTLNPLGSGNAGLGQLTIGTGQEIGVYRGSGAVNTMSFSGVVMTGSASFSPRRNGFGATTNVGGNLSLGNITESGAGGYKVTMNGTNTLFLDGNNAFTGGLQINSGIVQLGNDGALNSTTPQVVTFAPPGGPNASTQTLRLAGHSVAVGGIQTAAGAGVSAIIENANVTAATLTANIASDTTYAGLLQDGTGGGALGLTKGGAGKLIITGNSTNTGSVTINAGTLQIGNGAASGALGPGAVTDNGTLAFNRTDALTYTGGISGTGNFEQNGIGTVTLTGANSYSGTTAVNAGGLVVNGSLASGGSVTLASGASFGGSGSAGNTSMGSGGEIHPGSTLADGTIGTLTLSSLAVSGGALAMDITNTSTKDLITVTGNATFSGASTITPFFTGSPAAGDYVLLTASSISHTVDPTVNAPGSSRLAFTPQFLNGDTVLNLHVVGNGASKTWVGNINSNWDVNGANNWSLGGGDNKFLNLDSVTFDDSTPASPHTVTLTANVTPNAITVNTTTSYTIDTNGNVISGVSTPLTISAGTLVLQNTGAAATNTFGGPISIGSGTLEIGTGGTIGDGDISATGGTLRVNRTGSLTIPNIITGSANINVTGGGNVTLTGNNNYTGNIAVGNGTLNAGSATAIPSSTNITLGSGANSGVLNVNGINVTVASLATSGTGTANAVTNNSATTDSSLTFAGTGAPSVYNGGINNGTGGKIMSLNVTSGDITLTGNSTYTGNTTLSGQSSTRISGSSALGATGATSTITMTSPGATTPTVLQAIANASTGNHGVVIGANGAQIDVTTGNTLTVNGVLSGTQRLFKSGTGTLRFTNTANSFTGQTIIGSINGTVADGGVIEAVGSSFANLPSAGTEGVQFNGGRFHQMGANGELIISPTANKWVTGAVNQNAGNAATGTFDIDAGVTLQLGALDGTGQPTSTNPSLRTAGSGNSGGPFHKAGLGILRMVGQNNQLDDPFIIDQGIVEAWNLRSMGGHDNNDNYIVMKNATTLVLRNDGVIGQGTSNPIGDYQTDLFPDTGGAGSANITIDRVTVGVGYTATIGRIGNPNSGAPGAFTLNIAPGSNITSGSAGLIIGSLSPTTPVTDNTLGGDATFNINNSGSIPMTVTIIGTIGQTSTAVAGLNKTGNGILILQAANTFSGITTATGGVLRLSNANALQNSTVQISPNISYDPALTPFTFGGLTGSNNVAPTDTANGPITIRTGNNGSDQAYSGNMSGSVSLAKVGSGTQTMSGSNTYGGSTTVSAGRLLFTNSQVNTGSVTVDGGVLELSPVADPSAGTKVIKTGALTITGAKLDLQNNKLITTTAVGSATGGVYDGVTGYLQSGRNGGGWTGTTGIVTSQSNATGGNFTSIGVATAAQVKGIAVTATAVFAGQTVSGSDTLVMYTYGGDANLDGKLNVDDYGHIDSSIPIGLTGWFNGDFNYDGKINVDDYGIIDFNIGIQGPQFATGAGSAGAAPAAAGLSGVSAVPEPAGLGVIALGAMNLLGRRRRRGSDR